MQSRQHPTLIQFAGFSWLHSGSRLNLPDLVAVTQSSLVFACARTSGHVSSSHVSAVLKACCLLFIVSVARTVVGIPSLKGLEQESHHDHGAIRPLQVWRGFTSPPSWPRTGRISARKSRRHGRKINQTWPTLKLPGSELDACFTIQRHLSMNPDQENPPSPARSLRSLSGCISIYLSIHLSVYLSIISLSLSLFLSISLFLSLSLSCIHVCICSYA